MTPDDAERDLRDLFAADAAAAPTAVGLADGALGRVRRTRRLRTAGVAGLLLAAGVVCAVVLGNGPGDAAQAPPAAQSSEPAPPEPGSSPPAGPTGELPSAGVAECVEEYSPSAAVTGRAVAFDGTVVGIGPEIVLLPDQPFTYVEVTFAVDEWFRGGSGGTVTVQMDPPDGAYRTSEPVAVYGVGTRLLVSGEPRWGGESLEDVVAWSCGFTRYYDPATAAEWAAATG